VSAEIGSITLGQCFKLPCGVNSTFDICEIGAEGFYQSAFIPNPGIGLPALKSLSMALSYNASTALCWSPYNCLIPSCPGLQPASNGPEFLGPPRHLGRAKMVEVQKETPPGLAPDQHTLDGVTSGTQGTRTRFRLAALRTLTLRTPSMSVFS